MCFGSWETYHILLPNASSYGLFTPIGVLKVGGYTRFPLILHADCSTRRLTHNADAVRHCLLLAVSGSFLGQPRSHAVELHT